MTAFPTLSRLLLQSGLVLLIQSSALLLLSLALGFALRRRGPFAQSLVCRATLLAILFAGLLSAIPSPYAHPLWHVSLSGAPSAAPASQTPPAPVVPWSEHLPITLPSPSSVPVHSANQMPAVFPADTPSQIVQPLTTSANRLYSIAVIVWGVGALALLFWVLIGQLSLTFLYRRSVAVMSGPAWDVLQDLGRPLALRTAPGVRSPFLAGIRRPTIYLPASYAQEFDALTLRAILSHELAHRERADNAWFLLARFVSAILWFQPLVWVLCRRMGQTSEEVCDAMALASGCAPRTYAECLLSLAERLTPSRLERVMGVGIVPFRSSVGQRIQHVLHSAQQTPLSPKLRATIAAGAVLGIVLGSWLVSAADPPSSATDVMRQYLQDCAEGKMAQAYSLLSPETRKYTAYADFKTKGDYGPGSKFPTNLSDHDATLDATIDLLCDPYHTKGYRFEVVGAAPNAPHVVLIHAFPSSGAVTKKSITLHIVMTPDLAAGNAPRIDLVQSLRPVEPDVVQRLESLQEQKECARHLRMIGLAIMEYTQNHGERLPDADHWVDTILPYVKDKSVFHDPTAHAGQQYSYAYNRNLSRATWAKFENPATTILVFESTKGVKNASDTGQSLPKPGRHVGGNNYCLADGHIKYLRDWRRSASFSLHGVVEGLTPTESTHLAGRLGVVLHENTSIHAGRDRDGRVLSLVPKGQYLAISGETATDYAVLMSDYSRGYIAKSDMQLLNYQVTSDTPGNTLGQRLVKTAYSYLGIPFVVGGSTRDGLDSAHLVKAVFAAQGIPLPDTPEKQAAVGYDVPHDVRAGDAQKWVPGDRLYFSMHGDHIDHTGIYLGKGLFIHASTQHGRQVAIDRVTDRDYPTCLVAMRRSEQLLSEPQTPGTLSLVSQKSNISEHAPPASAKTSAAQEELINAEVYKAQKRGLFQQRAVLQQQLEFAKQKLTGSGRDLQHHPLPKPYHLSTASKRQKTDKDLSPQEAQIDFMRAVHQYNLQMVQHWNAISERGKWTEQVQQRRSLLKAIDTQIRDLESKKERRIREESANEFAAI